jgi:hypothetical protein
VTDLFAAGATAEPVVVLRALSPTGVCIVLLLALVFDYMGIGADSVRDRIAFVLATAGFRDGFDGSPLDRWTVERLSDFIEYLLAQTGGAYIAGASVNTIVGAAAGVLALYTLGCMLPAKASKVKLVGRLATLNFPTSRQFRLNWKVWVFAFLIGVLADLGRGAVGTTTNWAVETMTVLVAPLPNLLFGAA